VRDRPIPCADGERQRQYRRDCERHCKALADVDRARGLPAPAQILGVSESDLVRT
jgi:hypothetical protein